MGFEGAGGWGGEFDDWGELLVWVVEGVVGKGGWWMGEREEGVDDGDVEVGIGVGRTWCEGGGRGGGGGCKGVEG